MIVDNGEQRRLQIGGVFDGMCGMSRGQISFVPNIFRKRPEDAVGAMLGDEVVRLFDIARNADGRAYTARFASVVA